MIVVLFPLNGFLQYYPWIHASGKCSVFIHGSWMLLFKTFLTWAMFWCTKSLWNLNNSQMLSWHPDLHGLTISKQSPLTLYHSDHCLSFNKFTYIFTWQHLKSFVWSNDYLKQVLLGLVQIMLVWVRLIPISSHSMTSIINSQRPLFYILAPNCTECLWRVMRGAAVHVPAAII